MKKHLTKLCSDGDEETVSCAEEVKEDEDGDEDDEDQEDKGTGGLFVFPEKLCSAVFTSHYWFNQHVDRGLHVKVVAKDSTLNQLRRIYFNHYGIPKDQRPKSYHEGRILKRNLVSVERIRLSDSYPKSGTFGLVFTRGWALKKKRKSRRFSKKQNDFIQEKFLLGQTSGVSMKPQRVVEEMRTMKDAHGKAVFQPQERLSESQIKSMFSRIARKNKRNVQQQSDSDSSGDDEDDAEAASQDDNYNDFLTEVVDSFE